MKKIIIYICLLTGLFSCAKEAESVNEISSGIPVRFDIRVVETRAVKNAWSQDDIIYVFFKGLQAKYLKLTYNSGQWISNMPAGVILDTDFRSLSENKLTAIHFPVAVEVTFSEGKFHFSEGGKPFYNYYLFDQRDYSVDGSTVSATLKLNMKSSFVQLHVAGIQDNVSDHSLSSSLVSPTACTSIDIDGDIEETQLQPGAYMTGVSDSDGAIFSGQLFDPTASKYSFVLKDSDKLYNLTVNRTLEGGRMYNLPVIGSERWTTTDLYVDLGLSIRWATMNVGAITPDDYGDYFAWGETETYYESGYSRSDSPAWKSGYESGYSWSSYKWCNGTYDSLTKYCPKDKSNSHWGGSGTADGYTTLRTEDDVARVLLGDEWRLPTIVEFQELIDNCFAEWVTVNGVPGCRFTSNVNGYTNQSIFLPAAGDRYGNDILSSVDSYGAYWSSTIYSERPNGAQSLRFDNFTDDSGKVTVALEEYGHRFRGFTVRPVK